MEEGFASTRAVDGFLMAIVPLVSDLANGSAVGGAGDTMFVALAGRLGASTALSVRVEALEIFYFCCSGRLTPSPNIPFFLPLV